MQDTTDTADLRGALLAHIGGAAAVGARMEAVEADAPAPVLRQAAWAAFAASDDASGERLLRRAARHPDDAGEAWFALAMVRLGRNQNRRATAAFVAAVRARARAAGVRDGAAARIRQNSAGDHPLAAIVEIYAGFEDTFAPFALSMDVGPSERQPFSFLFDRSMSSLGRGAATDAILALDRARNGENFWFHVTQGHRCWVEEDRDQADLHYAAARDDVLRHRITPFHYNCGIIVWLSRARAVQLLEQAAPDRDEPGWTWHPAADGPRPVAALLVGFDPNYFVFFPKFLMSVVSAYRDSGTQMPFRVHCHIADAEARHVQFVQAAATAIATHLPSLTVSISTGPSRTREPAHYTCLRYLALPTLMRRLECGVVAMDVDAEILPGFFDSWPTIAEHAFGLRMYSFNAEGRQVGGEPWSIGAHPTFVADTSLGRRFAGFLRDYIDAAYDPTQITNWTVDQCAIARGYDLLLRDKPFNSIYNFATGAPLYRLPNDYGSKQAFLDADPITSVSFLPRLAALFAPDQ